ncbi:MAG TPA: BON domain-containing protein [Burkholderiales bacterium]|nr:BON domain-containing protein [Burkholderiales bacterium]
MKALVLAVSAVLALALAACSTDRNRSSSSGGASSTTSGIKGTAQDATLTTKVKSALAADVGLRTLTGISVTSDGSTVTLQGAVDTDANKRRAEQVARGVDGVSSVKNELAVEAKK